MATATQLFLVALCAASRALSMADYRTERDRIIAIERSQSIGGDVILNEKEKSVNEWLLALKEGEIHRPDCPAFRDFTTALKDVEKSEIFQFLKRLPKGGSLHMHLFASASFEYVYNDLLKRDDLYLCEIDGRTKLKFLKPNSASDCKRVSELLEDSTQQTILKNQLTINHNDTDKNITEIWGKFKKIFTLTYDLFTYVGVFHDYVYRILLEHYNDNVFYVELRAPFVHLYELDGTTYDEEHFVHALYKINRKFKNKHPKFIGMKYICALYRKQDPESLRESLNKLKALTSKYSDFIIGFDLVGFEDDAPLNENIEIIKESNLNFYFHAGETKNYGDSTDENIVDAVLLGSKRIGHAYSLSKHPELQRIIKTDNIAIELCPISNQVLELVKDLRNHPASSYIASGLPLVICNDDPGNWNAVGLSHDWYMTFMAMTHKKAGLEFLKKSAWNSIEYSGMGLEEKQRAFVLWGEEWDRFINESVLEIRSK